MRTWLSDALAVIQTAAPETGWNGLLTDEATISRADTVLRDMISRVECEAVWRMIERRHADGVDAEHLPLFAAMHGAFALVEELNRTGRQGPYSFRDWCVRDMTRREQIKSAPSPVPAVSRHEAAAMLAVDVALLLRQDVPQETRSMRASTLQQVERAIDALRAALPPVIDAMRFRDRELQELSELARFADRRVEGFIDFHRRAIAAHHDEADLAVGKSCARSVAEDVEGHLDALLAETLRWALEPPEIPRPNHKNAARLHFIRGLAALFRMHYGQPLPECVLAITGTFFEIDDLDESAIYKLTKDGTPSVGA